MLMNNLPTSNLTSFEMANNCNNVQLSLEILKSKSLFDHACFTTRLKSDGIYLYPRLSTTYPKSWLLQYIVGFNCHNPVAKAGFTQTEPFFWRDLKTTTAEKHFLAESEYYGIGPNGFSIPIVDKNRHRSLLSVSSKSMDDDDWRYFIESIMQELNCFSIATHKKSVIEIQNTNNTFSNDPESKLMYVDFSQD